MPAQPHRLGLAEAMGLLPLRERYRQAMITFRGEEDVPPSRFGVSSLRMLRPRIGIPLWLGKAPIDRKVIITNLFNHRQTPIEDGWSVLRTQVEDFRGKDLTYDSHNGTDFSIPLGTPVLAPAPGRVVRVVNEFNRGGLKIFIDHGEGLMTNCAHLGRALVQVGASVERGQPIALSGYSGLDGFSTFPWGTPHVHFNTWLNARPVDPFARAGETSLWRGGVPRAQSEKTPPEQEDFEPTVYDMDAVARGIASCKTARVRQMLEALPSSEQGARLVIEMNYYPTRFSDRSNVYSQRHTRRPRLDLPFSADAFDGVVFVDELP